MSDLPFVGWKACEQSFYLDGLRITNDHALRLWENGDAKFLPNAVTKIKEYAALYHGPFPSILQSAEDERRKQLNADNNK